MAERTYKDDLSFLNEHTDAVELATGDARIVVTPDFQGRVMTSTLAGAGAPAFGWINRDFIASGQPDPKFNNYGGEDRFWLGPEGGQFGLWFEPGEPFDMAHWKTPEGFDAGRFDVTSRGDASIAMAAAFSVTNAAGTRFDCAVQRRVSLLAADEAAALLGGADLDGLVMVGFESLNTLSNAGSEPWTRDGGLLSVWILGQFNPLPRGKVIVPFIPGDEGELGPRVATDYFGELPDERGVFRDAHFLFACDGKHRSKIGVSPRRARDVLGSYDPDANVLTIVQFSLPADAPERPYVNSMWEVQDRPFDGDAVNSYNDGEETPGAGQLGPFYEIETSSPAAELAPDGSIAHAHRTFHFAGEFELLNRLATSVLGVELREIG